MTKSALIAAVVLVCAVSSASDAQTKSAAQTRDGLTVALGLGGGRGEFRCDGCATDPNSGFSGFLRVGTALNPNFVVAGQINGWTHDEDGAKGTFGFLLGTTQFYPYTPIGWYLEGGIGYGQVKLEDNSNGDDLHAKSVSFLLGTGYDFRMATNVSLTPFLNVLSASGDEAKLNGVGINQSLGGTLVQFGVAFTWH